METIRLRDLANSVESFGERVGVNLKLNAWSPGDGWTRYQIVAVGEHGAEWEPFGSRQWTITEMESFVAGLWNGLEANRSPHGWKERLHRSCLRAEAETEEKGE